MCMSKKYKRVKSELEDKVKFNTNAPGVIESMWNAAKNDKEKELLIYLFDEACIYSADDFINFIEEDFINKLKDLLDTFSKDDFLIMGTKKNAKPGSAGTLFSFLKGKLPNGVLFDSIPEAKALDKKNKIIIIDDFVGTGNTIIATIKNLLDNLKESNAQQISFYIFSPIGTEKAQESLKKREGIKDVCFTKILPAVLNQYQKLNTVDHSNPKDHLRSLTKSFGNYKKNYVFGYQDSQVIYYRRGANCPNNVLGIFWCRRENEEKTLFERNSIREIYAEK